MGPFLLLFMVCSAVDLDDFFMGGRFGKVHEVVIDGIAYAGRFSRDGFLQGFFHFFFIVVAAVAGCPGLLAPGFFEGASVDGIEARFIDQAHDDGFVFRTVSCSSGGKSSLVPFLSALLCQGIPPERC